MGKNMSETQKDQDLAETMMIDDDDELQENKYLMCLLGDETYGINISYVTDIIELQKITAVPDMPDYVKGVINLRGQVIPIIDLRARFKMEHREYDDRTVITVVHIHDALIGFIIDTATEVQEIPEKNIDPPPVFQGPVFQGPAVQGRRAQKMYVSGLGKIDSQVIILLDMEALVEEKEAGQLKEAEG